MTNEEKLKVIEEAMDINEGTLKPTDLLKDYEEWDSLAALSLVAFVEKKMNKIINEKDLRESKIVSDLMNLM